jgi:small-conductance mechanosensitive channel/CRP-like cAMP-binding protein
MSSIFWSVGIVVVALVGVLGLRALPMRLRIAFDTLCLIALSEALYRYGVGPFTQPSSGLSEVPASWLRVMIVAWWLLSARVVVAILYFAISQNRKSREAKLFVDLIAAAIYISTAFIVLESVLALPVGGLVATSGVVAIVLGLALQSTLSDVFSGIAVGVEAPFQVGDRIWLGNKVEGQVIEMNWRSIRVQTDGADVAIIPNSVAAKLEIINRSVPSPRRSVSVEIWCPAAADPERVLDVLQQATLLCPQILQTPAANAALTRMGPVWNSYGISFSVADTPFVTEAKSLLLRQARKQLYHARLLARPSRRGAQHTADLEHPPILSPRRILGELALFECLEPAQLEHLATNVQIRLLERDELLFEQGATDATLYIVASGVLEVTQRTDTNITTPLGSLGAGDYLGEIGLLTGSAHAASARARTHCYIYCLSREALAPLLTANTELAAAFDKSVRRGLDILERSVAVRAGGNVGARNQLLQRIRTFFQFK